MIAIEYVITPHMVDMYSTRATNNVLRLASIDKSGWNDEIGLELKRREVMFRHRVNASTGIVVNWLYETSSERRPGGSK